MSPIGKAEDIQATAAAWFERREWSNWDAAAEEALQAWLAESTAHRIAFIRLEAAWEHAERLKALGAGSPAGRVPARASFGFVEDGSADKTNISPAISSLPVPEKQRSGRVKWAIGIASVAAVLALVVWHQFGVPWQVYGTPMGTIAPVALADGSIVTLDSNTRIRVALEANQRLIRLDQGKALFEVAKDPARPMVVQVDKNRVTAIGTEFSVQRDADEIAVLVKEGRVRIETDPHLLKGHATELAAGGEISTHGGEMVVARLDRSDVERALSWSQGYLEFQDTPLPHAVAEFNRYSTQKIEINDPSLDSIRIGGRFRCTDANAFLALLQQGFPVVVTRDENHVGLRRR